MIVPQFLRFYPGYTAETVMGEFALRFFALVNAMFRLNAEERITEAAVINAGVNGNEEVIAKLEKQSKGLHGIVKEVRTARGIKNG